MSWLIYSLLALTFFVVYEIAGRSLATKSDDPRIFATIYNFFVMLIAPGLFLFDQTLPHGISLQIILITIVGLIVWGLFGRFEYVARQNTEASVFTIVAKLAPVLNFFLSLIVFHESWAYSKLVGIALIVGANLLLFAGQKKGAVISAKGLKYTILVSVFLALGWLFDAINVKSWGVATFSIFSFLVPSLVSGLFPLAKISQIKKELSLSPWWQIMLLGFFNLAGYAFMLKALTSGPSSNVIPIVNSATPFVVLFGVIFLGERNHLVRKLIAGIVTLVAIYLMR